MKATAINRIDLNVDELEAIVQRATTGAISNEEAEKLKAVVESYAYITQLLEHKNTSLDRLRQLLFGGPTEKTRTVLGDAKRREESDDASEAPSAAQPRKGRRRGHGRNGADDYPGARRVQVPHSSLKPRQRCPECGKGKLYDLKPPGVLVRLVGQAPVQATVYEIQKLRCNLCGAVFTAEPPPGVGSEKYDATSAAMIAVLKYGSGLPFNRLQGLQQSLGIPLPASTQWDIVHHSAQLLEPAYEELIRQAAQGEVVHNDDTAMKILACMHPAARQQAFEEEDTSERTGIFTSGIVSVGADHRVALFFTSHQHAGENLSVVLAQRAAALPAPIQMCDALSRNVPGELKVILANCLAHGRRRFVEVAQNFPQECRHVLEALAEVYRNEAVVIERNLMPPQRLSFHQEHSEPVMTGLHQWLSSRLEQNLVEPNSGLGKAIAYLLKHWHKLTRFLEVPGAPLDNNLCERALKKAILHRKNSLFYKTGNGARVGDLFMSLIHTCQLNQVNPFDYLTELHHHACELTANPTQWLPWNYQDTITAPGTD